MIHNIKMQMMYIYISTKKFTLKKNSLIVKTFTVFQQELVFARHEEPPWKLRLHQLLPSTDKGVET